MRMLLVAFGLMLGLATLLPAGEIDEHQVPAEAKWLVHVDMDAALNSTIGKRFYAGMLHSDRIKQRFQAAGESLGLDPAKDIHGVLLYDRRFSERQGVAIIRADVDVKRLAAFVKELPDYQNTDSNGHQFHTFTDKRHKHSKRSVTVCVHDKEIVLGRNTADVIAAVEVLDGKSDDLTADNSPLGGQTTAGQSLPPGTILQIRAAGLNGEGVPFKSPIVRQSKTLAMIAGEHKGNAFVRTRLTAASDEVAQQIKAVIEGFIAVNQLQAGDDEEAQGVFRAAKVSTEGSVVTVEWKGTPDDLMRLIRKQLKEHADARHDRKRGSRPHSHDRK